MKNDFNRFDSFGGPVQQCVLPLVAKVDNHLYPVGTGFAINLDGLIITAAHVAVAAESKSVRRRTESGSYYNHYEFFAIYMTDRPNQENGGYIGGLLPVEKLWVPIGLDIAFGWLRLPINTLTKKKLPLRVVRIRPSIPVPGERITGVGYHKMEGHMADTDDNLTTIVYAQDTAVSHGSVIEVHPKYRERGMLNFPCFRTDARFDPGMSGGPIFHADGSVCGVICSSRESDTEGGAYISYGSLIWPIFGCEIEVATNPGTASKRTLLFDLAEQGLIATDATIRDVVVTRNQDGTRTVEIRHP